MYEIFKIEPFNVGLFMMKAKDSNELNKLWKDYAFDEIVTPLEDEVLDAFNSSKMMVVTFDDEDVMLSDVFFFRNTEQDYTNGIVAHEAYHVLNAVFEKIGYNHDVVNDELAAYHLEAITDAIHRFLNKEEDGSKN
jgi:hypothetical protein